MIYPFKSIWLLALAALTSVLLPTLLTVRNLAAQELAPKRPSEAEHFVAKLPNGNSVELLCVAQMGNATSSFWAPNGTKINIPNTWPKLLEVIGQNPTQGFIFRCPNFQKEQGLGWRISGSCATPTNDKPVPELVTVSSDLGDRKSTTIGVGVTAVWGPWQRVELDGTMADRVETEGITAKLYALVNSVRIESNDNGRLSTSVTLNGFAGEKQELDYGQYEIAIIDREGKRHGSSGSGIYKKGQIPYYPVTKEKIDYFEYRMRPYLLWVTFENISLISQQKTDVKITVTDVEIKEISEK